MPCIRRRLRQAKKIRAKKIKRGSEEKSEEKK